MMTEQGPATEELTATEAARRYNISQSWLIRQHKEGKIQARMIGPLYVFSRASLEHWLETRPKRGDNTRQRWQRRNAEVASAPARPAVAGDTQPPAPHETAIDTPEGAHIRIDALRPAGQQWLHAEATQEEMRATIAIRPYGPYASVYTLDKSYDRAETYAPGRMGRKQEQRGKALLALLEQHTRAALVAAGWHTEERAGNELWRYAGSEGQQ